MTGLIVVLAMLATLLAGFRWWLSRCLTARRVYPRAEESFEGLLAAADAREVRELHLATEEGRLRAWRDALRDAGCGTAPQDTAAADPRSGGGAVLSSQLVHGSFTRAHPGEATPWTR